MFTGIVESTGEVGAVEATADGHRVRVGAAFAPDLEPGDSVSVDGVCLTVEEVDDRSFGVFLGAETRERTALSDLGVGDRVNLERALPADGRFDGHFVQGHVDTTTEVTAVEPVGEDWTYRFALPADGARYVVEKGSIAIDGISLTVAERTEEGFDVSVVPTTYRETTLSSKGPGDRVNVEYDVIAKYVERLLA